VGENSNAIGIPISELKLADGVLVVCIEREGKTIIPKGDTKILSGDKVTIFTQSEKINKIINLFAGK
jgi:trk system potassium uptake protein TrkA